MVTLAGAATLAHGLQAVAAAGAPGVLSMVASNGTGGTERMAQRDGAAGGVTLAGSAPVSASQAITTGANASLISTVSMSSIDSPVLSRA